MIKLTADAMSSGLQQYTCNSNKFINLQLYSLRFI